MAKTTTQAAPKTTTTHAAPVAPAAPVAAAPVAPVAPVVAGVTPAAPVAAAPANGAKKPGGPGVQKIVFNKLEAIMNQVDDKGAVVMKDGKAVTVSAVNAEGKLIGVPVNYDFIKHSALKEEDFVDEPTFLEFKASVADAWAKRYSDVAAQYRRQATEMRKHGKPEDRKRIQKLEKMRAQFIAMREELLKEGLITQEEFDADKAKLGS